MTHYSENPGMTRFDFFKPESGKWYMTEALDMSAYYDANTVFDAVHATLSESRHQDLSRWIISVLEPYHKGACPVLLTPGRASYTSWSEAPERQKITSVQQLDALGTNALIQEHDGFKRIKRHEGDWLLCLKGGVPASAYDIELPALVLYEGNDA